jgi:hypothetical protein
VLPSKELLRARVITAWLLDNHAELTDDQILVLSQKRARNTNPLQDRDQLSEAELAFLASPEITDQARKLKIIFGQGDGDGAGNDVHDICVDRAGVEHCWKCGGQSFSLKRTKMAKGLSVGAALVLTPVAGAAVLAAKKRACCHTCGAYNRLGTPRPIR